MRADPTTARRGGEKRLSRCLSRKPCTNTDVSPTVNNAQPFCAGPQPYLKVVYSTKLECITNCASDARPITATSGPTASMRLRPSSALTGLARRHSKRRRRLAGNDSGSTKKPYSQFSTDSPPATKNGRWMLMAPSSPPITGPRTKPMPNIAPSMPKRRARSCGGVMSAT